MEWADNLTLSSPESLAIQISFLIMIYIVGLLLNLACLFVICRRYKALEMKKRYILLGNLLLCDFILLLWVIPVTVRLLSCSTSVCRTAVLNPTVCRVTAFLFQCSYICGIAIQVFLALDRMMTTAHPCVTLKYLTGNVYVTAVAFCWMFSAFHASIPLVPNLTGVSYVFSDRVKKCSPSFLHSCWYHTYANILVHGALAPCILLCYLYMAFRIRQLRSRCDSQHTTLINSVISSTAQMSGAQTNALLSSRSVHSKSITHHSRNDGSVDYVHQLNEVTSSLAENVSEVEDIFPEFLRVRQQTVDIADQGVQTSFVKWTSSVEKDEDESSQSSDSFLSWQKRQSVDTTIGSLSSQALSRINYIPSDPSDLKGFLLTQPFIGDSDSDSDRSNKQSEQVGMRRSSQGSKSLSSATVGSVQHGLCLVVFTYVWSVPYTMATKCPRGEVSFAFSIFAMWLCYGSAIFYPLVYFFMHENFIRHFRLSVSLL